MNEFMVLPVNKLQVMYINKERCKEHVLYINILL